MNKMAIIAVAVAAVAIAIGVMAVTQMQEPAVQPAAVEQTLTNSATDMTIASKIAVIETSQGIIKVEFSNAAPKHVESFLQLAQDGFYDGVLFHRIVPGFVIQGGDPLSKDLSAKDRWGTGGPGYSLDQEFNSIQHSRGIVSMARSSDPNSAGSQFFIVLEDSDMIKATLDKKYTVFGKVIEGMDVVDKIAALNTIGGNGRDSEQPANPDEAKIITIKITDR